MLRVEVTVHTLVLCVTNLYSGTFYFTLVYPSYGLGLTLVPHPIPRALLKTLHHCEWNLGYPTHPQLDHSPTSLCSRKELRNRCHVFGSVCRTVETPLTFIKSYYSRLSIPSLYEFRGCGCRNPRISVITRWVRGSGMYSIIIRDF